MEKSIKLGETEFEIFRILVDWVKTHPDSNPITYKDLAETVSRHSVIPHNLGLYLGRVSEFCMAHDAPAISAIVGGKDTFEPGNGFFTLLGYTDVKQDEKLEIWMKELKKVYAFSDWDSLLNLAQNSLQN